MNWRKGLRNLSIAMIISFLVSFMIKNFVELNSLFHTILIIVIGLPIYIYIMHFVRRGDKIIDKPLT